MPLGNSCRPRDVAVRRLSLGIDEISQSVAQLLALLDPLSGTPQPELLDLAKSGAGILHSEGHEQATRARVSHHLRRLTRDLGSPCPSLFGLDEMMLERRLSYSLGLVCTAEQLEVQPQNRWRSGLILSVSDRAGLHHRSLRFASFSLVRLDIERIAQSLRSVVMRCKDRETAVREQDLG